MRRPGEYRKRRWSNYGLIIVATLAIVAGRIAVVEHRVRYALRSNESAIGAIQILHNVVVRITSNSRVSPANLCVFKNQITVGAASDEKDPLFKRYRFFDSLRPMHLQCCFHCH